MSCLEIVKLGCGFGSRISQQSLVRLEFTQ